MIPREQQYYNIPNFYGGINRVDAPNSLPPNMAITLTNHTFGDSNMMEVVPGFSAYTTISEDEGAVVDGLFRYDDLNVNHNLALYRGNFYELTSPSNTPSEITPCTEITFGAGGRVVWSIYDDIVFFSNSQAWSEENDPLTAYRYTAWADGNKLRTTGIPVPVETAIVTAVSTGGDLPKGTYKFLFTLDITDGAARGEGNPNATETAVVVENDGTDKITISITAPDPLDLYTNINVYVTDCDGNVFYWLDSKALSRDADDSGDTGSTGTYTFELSAYSDIVPGVANKIEYDNYRPPAGSCNAIMNNHMFIGGVANHKTYLYISKINKYEQFPGNVGTGDPVSSAYVLDMEDRIIALKVARNGALLVLCQSSIQAVSGYGVDSFSRIFLSRTAGISGAGSAATSSNGYVFWRGHDDFYVSDGASVSGIGKYVWPIVKNMADSDCNNACGYFWKSRYFYSYSIGIESHTLELDTRYPIKDAEGNVLYPGAWLGPHSFGVSCFAKSRREGEEVAFIGDSSVGIIHKMGLGNDFNGTTIESTLLSGYIYFDAPLITKRFISIGIDAFPTSATPTCSMIFDYNKREEVFRIRTSRAGTTKYQHESSESGSTDDKYTAKDNAGVLGTARYAARFFETVKHRFSQKCTGDCAQLRIYCKNENASAVADRSFALRNIGISFAGLRRFRG